MVKYMYPTRGASWLCFTNVTGLAEAKSLRGFDLSIFASLFDDDEMISVWMMEILELLRFNGMEAS